ncbi:MAG: lipoyl(octanoyl) transferase LipB, partial [Myxococcota bacterium]
AGDRLLLLEHPSVLTQGRSARPEHLLVSPEELADRGIELYSVQRGGDITYHAPGQLVGYLIVDLAQRGRADVHAFLRRIEAALIEALGALALPARRVEGMTGVFAGEPFGPDRSAPVPARKIASIGVGLRRWVSFHGFALNVTIELAGFESIVACGLKAVEMTSLERELRLRAVSAPDLDRRARDAVSDAFRHHFG